MANLSSAKMMGGVGSILMIVGSATIPLISLVGFIMVLIAVKYIADEVKDRSIYSNFLISVILNIVAVVVIIVSMFLVIGGFSYFATITSGQITDPFAFISQISNVLFICIAGFIIFYIINIIAALYLKKSFDSITEHTKVDIFKIAGFVYLLSAVLVIIGIGFFVMFIAEILMIVAFFSLPDTLTKKGAPQTGQPAPPFHTGRMCPDCGRAIPFDAQICPYCGKDFRKKK